jgi:hypothetical protein
MFLLSWLPDIVFHLLLIAGVLGIATSFVLGFIPFVSTYKLPIQVASGLLIVVSVWFEGGIVNEAKWQARVQELEAKVAKAETQSAEANTRLVSELARNREKITANQIAVKQAIQQNIAAINRRCKLTDVSVDLYNQAVRGGQQ